MDISNRVKYIRHDILHLTMEEFGKRLGVTNVTISRIESGQRNVTEQMLTAIVREFRVNEDWLRYGMGEPFSQEEPELVGRLRTEYNLTDLEASIITEFLDMNAKERAAVLDFIRSLVHKAEERIANEKSRPLGTPEGIADAEAAYEKKFGIAPSAGSTASSTTEGTGSGALAAGDE